MGRNLFGGCGWSKHFRPAERGEREVREVRGEREVRGGTEPQARSPKATWGTRGEPEFGMRRTRAVRRENGSVALGELLDN
jgi:hypothetical protein